MPLLIAMLLGLAALFVVITPLLGLKEVEKSAAALATPPEVGEQEQSAKQALRDVDFDHRLGNLDEADYAALRDRYEDRALEAMKARYDTERELDALIERQLAALRDQERAANGHPSILRKAAKTATPSPSPHGRASPLQAPRRGFTRQPPDAAETAESAKTAAPSNSPPRQPGLSRRRGGTA